tara:strand:- start:11885 stop:12271 length:387 start_codon:yes stop_codon:yes gene_type:complete
MNTWVCIIIAIIALIWMFPKNNKQVQVDNFYSNNFEISPDSRKMFHKMQKSGLSLDSLKKFVMMEDRFLEYEKESACMGRDRVLDSTSLDQVIRETFVAYDFTYHNNHLKQIAETNRVINPYLKCYTA